MWTIKSESEFAAAHFLTHYHGKCERLHGHNYRVVVWLRGSQLDSGGMLADFGLVKAALRTVTGELDHTNLNDNVFFKDDPSAERIAQYIFTRMTEEFPAHQLDAALLQAVDVYETPINMARYERPC
ncbi:MAG: 6-carboxytetrahydropterin synthase QueD [Spirochaetaceae bacterium]|jgi:6-pyruvoyltetrahydropterin/6-carboxytetrahydropterin synthase|nr:6-carboxytetrahydropterin synthase QueD [Spirochaetaceae bacterium]